MALHIITGPAQTTPSHDHHIDASTLPNPHDVPKLRPRNGTDPMVRCWILDHVETQRLILTEVDHILTAQPEQVTVTCTAGWHRSVAVGDEIARRLQAHGHTVTIEHQGINKRTRTTPASKPTPRKDREARGYGLIHKRQRQALLNGLKAGTPCWWCNLPMHGDNDKTKNWDGKALAADHDTDRAATGGTAGRLLHFTCNSQRQGGDNDHLRPALTGLHPSKPLPTVPARSDAQPTGFDFGGVTFT